jgi:hypothetical protein
MFIMSITFRPVKSADYHPEVSEPAAAYSASVNDFFEAYSRLSSESARTTKEAEIELGYRKAVYWLISLLALVSLLTGIFCLMESATARTTASVPSQDIVTFGEAIQTLSIRH